MKKWKWVLPIVIILVVLFGELFHQSLIKRFSGDIEENAQITIAVETKEYGEALINLWNETYPDYRGILNYKIADRYLNPNTDIMYGRMDELSEVTEQLLDLELLYGYSEEYRLDNEGRNVFLPIHQEGLVFVYNETMLKSWGISTVDGDGDGLPEAFDTFEEIFQLAAQWAEEPPLYKEKNIEYIFPLTFIDSWSFYPFITTGGWRLCKNGVLEDPGFNQYEFLLGMEFIYELGNYQWSLVKEEPSWQYENVLLEESAPFSMIGNWTYHDYYQMSNQSVLRIARFPSYKGQQPAPLVHLYGYAVRKNTLYPQACLKVMELLQSDEGYQLLVDYGEKIPILPKERLSNILIEDQSLMEWMTAYQYSQVVPYGKIEGITVMDRYYSAEFMEIFQHLFYHEMEPQDTVDAIIEWNQSFGKEE